MDDWLKQLQADIHEAAKDSSDWFATVSQQSAEAVEQWAESAVDTIERVDKEISPALEKLTSNLDTAVDSAIDNTLIFLEQDLTPWLEEVSAPVTRTVNPWLQHHPACIGCKHYHGMDYGHEMLVCGMHPYGPEDRSCGDWESVLTQ